MKTLVNFLITLALVVPMAAMAANSSVVVTVKNPIAVARPSETIVLQAAELRKLLSVEDVRKVHVRDDATGKELLTQAVDLDDDSKYDEFLFQADLGPSEVSTFTLSVGNLPELKPSDFKAYGRFVQERRDDFAWENDRIAHRVYGAALETWAHEPLTSSAIDIWTKKVRHLVINDWYMVDNYHVDHGEGADYYSAGATRGCGGNGIWLDGALYPSANFRGSRLIANGPIRVMFELTYLPWNAKDVRVSEVKRVTLDAGHNLDRYESTYKFEGTAKSAQHAAGIRKGAQAKYNFNASTGTLRTWEPLKEGTVGIGVIVDPATIATAAEDKSNYLVVSKLPESSTFSYYAGFGWDKSGDFASVEDWDRYLDNWAKRISNPVEVKIAVK
jgi:hypothetical protein